MNDHRLLRWLAGALVTSSVGAGTVVVAASLGACWVVATASQPATVGQRSWFLFPLIVAAARFHWRGALVTAVAAGVLAGPGLPSAVPLTSHQLLVSSLSRALFFVVTGQVLASLFAIALAEAGRQRQILRGANAMAVSLQRDEFVVWYQPVVELAT